jgi:hypothetical protein
MTTTTDNLNNVPTPAGGRVRREGLDVDVALLADLVVDSIEAT